MTCASEKDLKLDGMYKTTGVYLCTGTAPETQSRPGSQSGAPQTQHACENVTNSNDQLQRDGDEMVKQKRKRDRRSRGGFWAGTLAEVSIILASLVYVISVDLWALIAWEILALIYLGIGLSLTWSGTTPSRVSRGEVRAAARWAWVLPLISSFAGVTSAVLALLARGDGMHNDAVLGIAASFGVVLSWTLLHTGFAHMYETLDLSSDKDAITFPGNDRPVFLNYLYFSFTIGTSFATSDATLKTIATRRLVLIHGVVSFFYNALVVAVAFQVLQHAVAS